VLRVQPTRRVANVVREAVSCAIIVRPPAMERVGLKCEPPTPLTDDPPNAAHGYTPSTGGAPGRAMDQMSPQLRHR
jgi:hypothetical protein